MKYKSALQIWPLQCQEFPISCTCAWNRVNVCLTGCSNEALMILITTISCLSGHSNSCVCFRMTLCGESSADLWSQLINESWWIFTLRLFNVTIYQDHIHSLLCLIATRIFWHKSVCNGNSSDSHPQLNATVTPQNLAYVLDNNHSSGIIQIRTVVKFHTVPDGAWFTSDHVSESVQM